MKILSLNLSLPRLTAWKGETISTGIFKQPVAGRVRLRTLNFDGDRQADLSVHGGPDKAVYAYPSEHYPFWRGELPEVEMNWGMFGENLTTEGLLEVEVKIGDVFQIGSAVIRVTQPRIPCYKLQAKFQRDDILKRVLASGRSGFYFAVDKEGEAGAGDDLTLISREEHSLTIAAINDLYTHRNCSLDQLQRAAKLSYLPAGWRKHFQSLAEEAARRAESVPSAEAAKTI
jgi:MOSC domain-containing protein YiiM